MRESFRKEVSPLNFLRGRIKKLKKIVVIVNMSDTQLRLSEVNASCWCKAIIISNIISIIFIIAVPPNSVTLKRPKFARSGDFVELACTAMDSNPKTTVVWFRGNAKTQVPILDAGNFFPFKRIFQQNMLLVNIRLVLTWSSYQDKIRILNTSIGQQGQSGLGLRQLRGDDEWGS